LDTLELFETKLFNIDLLISSDHLMHLQSDKGDAILKHIATKWKPKYLLIREVKKRFEILDYPKIHHDYDILDKYYKTLVSTSSKQDDAYFIKLYERI